MKKTILDENTNVFKFKSFNEHLSQVSIKLIKRVDTHAFIPDDESNLSTFYLTLQKNLDLNRTSSFQELKKDLGYLYSVKTLPQIFNQKNFIFRTLIDHLNKPNNLALYVIIDLISSLAQDIGDEFYPLFDETFINLVKHLDTQDVNLIENIFLCLAFLFKILGKCMIKDFKKIFKLFSAHLFRYNQKDYIKNFAAQSLSYLIRKTPKNDVLIDFLLKRVSKNPGIALGVSSLIFECVKGIGKQFNSYFSLFIRSLLNTYATEYNKHETIKYCIRECFELIINHTDKENSLVLWSCLHEAAVKYSECDEFKVIIELILQVTEFKKCILVNEPIFLVKLIIENLKKFKDDDCCLILLQLGSKLLVNLHQKINDYICQLLDSACDLDLSYKLVYKFTEELFPSILFDRDIFPKFNENVEYHLNQTSLNEFNDALIILKKLLDFKIPFPLMQSDLTMKLYPLNLKRASFDKFMNILSEYKCWEQIRNIIRIIPHIISLNKEVSSGKLINIIMSLKLMINQESDEEKRILFETTCIEAIYALILMDFEALFNFIKIDFFIDNLKNDCSNERFIQGLIFFLQYSKKCKISILSMAEFEHLYFNYLEPNLRSPKRSCRLGALIIANILNPPLCHERGEEEQSVFQICLKAEIIPHNLFNFREKVRFITLLDRSLVEKNIPKGIQSYDFVGLNYLFGCLYTNFSVLWSPISKIIDSYAREAQKDNFWKIFKEHFIESERLIYVKKTNQKSLWESIENEYDARFDALNHRVLLLNILKLFVNIVENFNKDIVEFFFNFIEKEGFFINVSRTRRKEILKKDQAIQIDVDFDENKKNDYYRKSIWKTLIGFLEIFAEFKNPQNAYKEYELREIYNILLCSKNGSVQKAALQCLFAYNYPFIDPYRNNLLRILDDSSFKTEIVFFNLSRDKMDDEYKIKENHRKELVPYLMRIMYGKMLGKTGIKTSGKSNADLRRSIVFRFLSCCDYDEMMIFIKMSLQEWFNFLQFSYIEIEKQFINLNLDQCIPLKYTMSSLRTLEAILNNLGNIEPRLLKDCFKIISVISFYVKALLDQKDNIHKSKIIYLKDLRISLYKIVKKFFKKFNRYQFTCEQIDALFKSLIGDMLSRLQNESLFFTSPLLKLINAWSCNTRYHIILTKKCEDITPLEAVMQLYSNDKTKPNVITYITQMLVNIFNFENPNQLDKSNDQEYYIEINNSINDYYLEEYKKSSNEINFSTLILKPYLSRILGRLKKNFEEKLVLKKNKTKESIITDNEATILAHIIDLVTDENDSMTLLNLLIKSIRKYDKRNEAILKTLKSINTLIKQTKENLKQFIPKLSKLFCFLSDRLLRLELCDIFSSIAINEKQLAELAKIVEMLNAYNPRIPEEPDYNMRDEGFKLCHSIINGMMVIDIELYLSIVYNCCFFIQTTTDLGLRESSSNLLCEIVRKLSESDNNESFKRICVNILMKEIFKGLKDQNENVRVEFIIILDVLIRKGKEKHTYFRQLSLLCNENEIDLDFWVNIRHIQVHRRVRALSRFRKNTEIFKQLSTFLLVNIFLPLASSILFDSKYAKYTTAVSESIIVIGVISRYLPWHNYDDLLKLYLSKLSKEREHQKTLIRIISVLLDNFNYDLSKCDANENIPLALKRKRDFDEERQKLDDSYKKKILLAISHNLLPQLHDSLHRLAYADYEHDCVRNEYLQEDEMKRISLAIPMVKLLLNLPLTEKELKDNIKSIFLRLCTFLKSRNESVREASRSTLSKIMNYLGGMFLNTLISDMRSILTKGYQMHVLSFTLHVLLENMASNLSAGELDESVDQIVEVCMNDIFGEIAEEKEVDKIVSKLKEAKKIKSFDIFRLVGRFISENKIIAVLLPLKQVLSETISVKDIKKVSMCLEKYFNGLTANTGLTSLTLITFIRDALEDKIPELCLKKPIKETKKVNKRKDILLITPIPERTQKKAKINSTSNVFVLFEHCFKLLLNLLKRERLDNNEATKDLINNLIPLLKNSLLSKHPKLTSAALKCINHISLKFKNLPEFTENCNIIKNNIMVLLHECSGGKASDETDLISNCFKTLGSLIKELDILEINDDQLEILLIYIDQSIEDRGKQKMAFTLLKSILCKKLESPELKTLLEKINRLMIRSDSEIIRNECRALYLRYMLHYKLKKGFESSFLFIIRQTSYKHPSGRESSLKFLLTLVTLLSFEILEKHLLSLFVALSLRLINDFSFECRDLANKIILILLEKISSEMRNKLFNDIVMQWFQDGKIKLRQLGAKIIVLFAEAEKEEFNKRLTAYLPLLDQQLDPDRYSQKVKKPNEEYEPNDDDHLIYDLLKLSMKTLTQCDKVCEDKNHSHFIKNIMLNIEKFYICHPNVWIQVLVLELYGQLLACIKISDFKTYLIEPKESNNYILNDCPQRLWSICVKHFYLFSSVYKTSKLCDALLNNLLLIGRIIKQLPQDWSPKNVDKTIILKLNYMWLMKRLIREINRELCGNPLLYRSRLIVFKWISVMVLEDGTEQIKDCLKMILTPLCREIANKGIEDIVKHEKNDKYMCLQICFQLYEILKSKVDDRIFSTSYAQVLSYLNKKRSERKALKAIEFVTNPMIAVMRKQKKHIAYRKNKKRKRQERWGKLTKRQKLC